LQSKRLAPFPLRGKGQKRFKVGYFKFTPPNPPLKGGELAGNSPLSRGGWGGKGIVS